MPSRGAHSSSSNGVVTTPTNPQPAASTPLPPQQSPQQQLSPQQQQQQQQPQSQIPLTSPQPPMYQQQQQPPPGPSPQQQQQRAQKVLVAVQQQQLLQQQLQQPMMPLSNNLGGQHPVLHPQQAAAMQSMPSQYAPDSVNYGMAHMPLHMQQPPHQQPSPQQQQQQQQQHQQSQQQPPQFHQQQPHHPQSQSQPQPQAQQPQGPHRKSKWDADRMLHAYIYDYLNKRGLMKTAEVFQSEAKLTSDTVPINAPGGFLFEWWSVFWDVFSARANKPASREAQQFVEGQYSKQQLRLRQLQQQQQFNQAMSQNRPPPMSMNPGQPPIVMPPVNGNPPFPPGVPNEMQRPIRAAARGGPGSMMAMPTKSSDGVSPVPIPKQEGAPESPQSQAQQPPPRISSPGNSAKRLKQEMIQQQQNVYSPSGNVSPSPTSVNMSMEEWAANQQHGVWRPGMATMAGVPTAGGAGMPANFSPQQQNEAMMRHSILKTSQQQHQMSIKRKTAQIQALQQAQSQMRMKDEIPDASKLQQRTMSSEDEFLQLQQQQQQQLQLQQQQQQYYQQQQSGMGRFDMNPMNNPIGMEGEEENIDAGKSFDENLFSSMLDGNDGDTKKGIGSPSPSITLNLVRDLTGHNNKVTCSSFSADGTLLATGGHDRKILIWSTSDGSTLHSLIGHSDKITGLRFNDNDKNLLVTSSFDRTIRVWDCASSAPTCIKTFQGHSTSSTSADFSRINDNMICSTDNGGKLMLWNFATGQCEKNIMLNTSNKSLKQVRFHPSRNIVAVVSDSSVTIFDVDNWQTMATIQSTQKQVNSVDWSNDGSWLVAAGDESIGVYDTDMYQPRYSLDVRDRIVSCTFVNSYPNCIIFGCYKLLYVWDFILNQQTNIQAHQNVIADVSSSDKFIASASNDHFVKLWQLQVMPS